MKDCLIDIKLGNAMREIADAMKLNVPLGKLGFRCPECHEPVKPFKDGVQGPHFEHLDLNKGCSLSDK